MKHSWLLIKFTALLNPNQGPCHTRIQSSIQNPFNIYMIFIPFIDVA